MEIRYLKKPIRFEIREFEYSALVVGSRELLTKTHIQSHDREVPRWEIFMEQELRFGLDLGRMADFPAFIASKSFDL
jgi:hypothetical protein